ncbi:MAG: tRNA (cytosine(32)/uridine(32)-2'-O)-methyltransferase TrmJ [bacterium]|nr:tRNA (cytosine(32)/uridine(32)-2'-O)-methyltransferase TrmJ [bacterium]
MFANIRIVLVNTTLPANIGSAARAMKTMGLADLYLVDPKIFPSAEATALASGASDILARARIVGTLEEAVADCSLVIGTSARSRTIPWPLMDARQAGEAVRIESETHAVAIVFGREDRGLTNEELQRCNYHVSIPTDEEYGVLNIAAAVQVLAYEVRMAHLLAGQQVRPDDQAMPVQFIRWDEEIVPHGDMERFYSHFEQMLIETGFLAEDNPRQLLARARRLFGRVRLDRIEYNMWRGIFTRLQEVAAELKKAKG